MPDKAPRKWTDSEVVAYLEASKMPVERCRVESGLYGFVDEFGKEMVVVDDDDERAARVVKFLLKIGAAPFAT